MTAKFFGHDIDTEYMTFTKEEHFITATVMENKLGVCKCMSAHTTLFNNPRAWDEFAEEVVAAAWMLSKGKIDHHSIIEIAVDCSHVWIKTRILCKVKTHSYLYYIIKEA